MMASFCEEIDFYKFNEFHLFFYDLIKQSNSEEVIKKLPIIEKQLIKIERSITKKYPIKVEYEKIAEEWNNLFKNDIEILSNGVMIGWLEKLVDLSNFYKYDYYPYHFKIGLAIHKGRGEIEEHFLLRDAFKCLVRAEKYLKLLENYGNYQKKLYKEKDKTKFDNITLTELNTIKFEVSYYSRLTIISFYSFIECFVNSIGFDNYYRKERELNETDLEILQGLKKGRFLNLKYKIEAYQKILRKDKTAKIVLSDNKQVKDPFLTFFNVYEEIRNSAVHYSPNKTKIWIKPHDWILKAKEFSKLTVQAAKIIWISCYETDKGPDYLGRLDYEKLYKLAIQSEKDIERIIKINDTFDI